jgi:hypothetical protein
MKTIKLISAAVLCIIAAASCSKEIVNGPDTVRTTISAKLESTKTALGAKVGDEWPNYWKTGDQISVNGVASEALDSQFDGSSSAEFTFAGALSVPYCAAYPASAVSGYSNGEAILTVPAVQNYVDGSYDPAAFIMGGKSNNSSSVSLSPWVSLFHLSLSGSASVSRVKLTSLNGTALSGTFSTNFTTKNATDVSDVVEMVAAAPVALPAEFFICVPSGLEGSLKVEVFDNDGGSMAKQATIKSTLVAGQMYSPATLPYTATYGPKITAEGITSSTAVICWSNSSSLEYTIGVYSDSACNTLVDSYTVPAGDTCWGSETPRFCISGLTPGTTYYVKVTDEDHSADSNILPVTTAAFDIVEVSSTPASVGEVILAEDFGELRWDSDVIGKGVGYFPSTYVSFDITDVAEFRAVGTSSEKVLSSQTDAINASRLASWAQGANKNLYIHPGYIKLVGSGKVTHLVTPELNNIPDGKFAELEVTVTANRYYSESSGSYTTDKAVIAVQPAGSYDELAANETNSLDLTSNFAPITLLTDPNWNSYTVTVRGVSKGDRLAFGAADGVSGNDARMNISDIKVTLKALNDPGDILTASLKAVSSSTASLTWSHDGEDAAYDISKPYTASLYSDSACSNLVVSHEIEADASCWDGKKPCFSFGGLAPSTDYWFVVEDTDNGAVSNTVSFTTDAFTPVDASTVTNAAAGDVILAEDFSEIGWGPDEFAVAAGFVPSPKNLDTPSGANPTGLFTEYSNTGNRIFGAGVNLGDSRLSHGWGFFGNSAVYLRNAYLRISTTAAGARTHLVTPVLAGIPDGKLATIEVTVTATKHESNTNDVAVFVERDLVMNGTTDLSSGSYKKYTGASLSDGHALGITSVKNWETKTVTITGVNNENQLVIGSYENIDSKNRFSITDVKVTIVSLADDPVKKIKDNVTFMEFVDAVAGGNKTLDARVVSSFEVTSANAAAFESIENYEGTLDGNGKTITGLTKPLFNNLKGTVKDLTLNSALNITEDQKDLGILANIVSGTVTGCTSKGSVVFAVATEVSEEHRIGGLIGSVASSGATVTDCTNEASVTNNTSNSGDGELIIGGVVGSFWGTEFHISGCENTGDIISTSHWSKTPALGGIMGQGGNSSGASSDFSIDSCTNSGAVSFSGTSDNSIQIGGIAGYVRFATMTTLSNSGAISNSGTASANVCVGGLLGWVDKNCTITETKGTNSGTVTNSGSGKVVSVGGILGRNSSGYLNATGSSSKYLQNNGTISDESSTNADDLSVGGIVGYTTTGIKLQYARNYGEIKVLNGTRDADVEVGGIAGWLDNQSLNVNNCRNYGDVTVSSTINGSLWAGGIVGLFNVKHTTDKYNLVLEATIDTHEATVSGENYTAGLFGSHSGTGKATYLFNGLKFNGTVIGNKTKAGLLCNSCNAGTTVTFKGSCKIAPGSSRQDDNNNDTVNSDSDLTMDVICGYLGSGSTVSGVSVEAY